MTGSQAQSLGAGDGSALQWEELVVGEALGNRRPAPPAFPRANCKDAGGTGFSFGIWQGTMSLWTCGWVTRGMVE